MAKTKKAKTLRSTFLLWLLGLMSVTFVSMFFASYGLLTNDSVSDADDTIKNRLEDAETVIRDNNRSLQSIIDYNHNEVLYKSSSSRAALNMLSDSDYNRLTPFSVLDSQKFRALYFEAYYDKENFILPFYEITKDGAKPYKNQFISGNLVLDEQSIYLTKVEKVNLFSSLTETYVNLIRESEHFLDTFGVNTFNLISGNSSYSASRDDKESGYVISSTVPGFIGYDMYQRYIDEEKRNTQSLEFMNQLFSQEETEYTQEVSQDITNTYMIYGGSKDIKHRSGSCLPISCIQVGFIPEKGLEILKRSDINTSAKTFRISESGGICICIKDSAGKYIIKGATNAGEGQPNNYLIGKSVDEVFNASSHVFDSENPDFKDAIFDKTALRMSWRSVLDDPGLTVDSDYMVIGVILYNEIYASRDSTLISVAITEGVTLLVVYILTSLLVELKVARKLKKVNTSLYKITNGDLNEKVDEKGNKEFIELAKDINTMIDSLKNLIANEKNRLASDLDMARDIQASALPSIFPPYPDREEFDIYASMQAAKKVGGDFYDFFFSDPDHLCFIIADVSGKGIPASLFMMRAKAIIKGLAETRRYSPKEIINLANKVLCDGNKAAMFVTAFFVMVNVNTGEVKYCNAGHNHPLLLSKGKYKYLQPAKNIVLGILNDKDFVEGSFVMEEGDTLYLYTDGITEAMNKDGDLYGENRLLILLNSLNKNLSVKDIIEVVTNDVLMFEGTAEQTDDMTQLCFTYHGLNKKDVSYTYKDSTINLSEAQEDIKHFLGMKVEPDILNNILVVCEEIFVNICSYSNTISHSLEMHLSRVSSELSITFIDDGVAFNPLKKEDPNVTLEAKDREIGGLGIYMIKNLCEDITYRRYKKKNYLKVSFKIK